MSLDRIPPQAARLFLALALATGTASAQQLPSVTPEQAQAGTRVTSATFEAPATAQRGDTLSIRANLYDADGNLVEDAVVLFTARGGLRALDGRMRAAGRFVANTPGPTPGAAPARVPAEAEGRGGRGPGAAPGGALWRAAAARHHRPRIGQ